METLDALTQPPTPRSRRRETLLQGACFLVASLVGWSIELAIDRLGSTFGDLCFSIESRAMDGVREPIAIHELRVTSQCGSPCIVVGIVGFRRSEILGYRVRGFPADRSKVRVDGGELSIATSRPTPGDEQTIEIVTTAVGSDVERPTTNVMYGERTADREAVERRPSDLLWKHVVGCAAAIAMWCLLRSAMKPRKAIAKDRRQ